MWTQAKAQEDQETQAQEEKKEDEAQEEEINSLLKSLKTSHDKLYKMKEISELNASRISFGIHTAVGIAAGYISIFMGRALYSLGLAVLILIITGYLTEFVLKKKGIKWWMANGGVLYILVWLVSWIFFFNM